MPEEEIDMSLINNQLEYLKSAGLDTSEAGKANDAFADQTGEHPKAEYFFQSGFNKSAKGAAIHNLEVDAAVADQSFNMYHETPSEYQKAQVKETASGHVIIYDDTAAGPRILLKHASGSGIEMKPDGSIVINSRDTRVDIVSGNSHMVVEGNGTLSYAGDLNLKVGGDFNLEVGGDYSMKIAGHWIVNVFGSYTKRIIGMMVETVQKVKSVTVLKDVTHTYLGNFKESVKNTYGLIVRGEADLNFGKELSITSEVATSMTSRSIVIAAPELALTGDVGVIGGENMVMFNYNMYTGHSITAVDTVTSKSMYATDTLNSQTITGTRINSTSMHATTFHGDLTGMADQAISADTANVGPSTGSAAGFTNNNTTADAVDATAVNTARGPSAEGEPKRDLPTADFISTLITKSAYMIQQVVVDQDDGAYNYLNKEVTTGGVTDRPLSVNECRFKLGNPNNESNQEFVQEQIKDGVLSSSYVNKSPPHIGRVIGADPQSRLGGSSIGRHDAASSNVRFKPSTSAAKTRTKFLIPEAKYNPNKISKIRIGTLIGKGLPLAKFFTENDTMEGLNNEERRRIARNLVAQTRIINIARSAPFMKGYHLNVLKGVVIPSKTEKPAPVNHRYSRSQIGRQVIYTVISTATGKRDNDVTFDLACYLKDMAHYHLLILSYDTMSGDKDNEDNDKMFTSIAVVMPEMPESYKATFDMKIMTSFNGKTQSSKDLVEIMDTSKPVTQDASGEPLIDKSGFKEIKTKRGYIIKVAGPLWNNFQGFINELEYDYNYKIRSIVGYNKIRTSTPIQHGNNEWAPNASGMAININEDTNKKDSNKKHDLPDGIEDIAARWGLGWGGNFAMYKDSSLFSARTGDGGAYSNPLDENVYETDESKVELKEAKAKTSLPHGTFSNLIDLQAGVDTGNFPTGSYVTYYDQEASDDEFAAFGTRSDAWGPTQYQVWSSHIHGHDFYTSIENGDPEIAKRLQGGSHKWSPIPR